MRKRTVTTTEQGTGKTEYLDYDEQNRVIAQHRNEFQEAKVWFERTVRWLAVAGSAYSAMGPALLLGIKGRLHRFTWSLGLHGVVGVLMHLLNLHNAYYENKPQKSMVVLQWVFLCLFLMILIWNVDADDEDWLLHLTIVLWYWGTAILGTYVASSLKGMSRQLNNLSGYRYQYRTV